jgi:hypothetical protein
MRRFETVKWEIITMDEITKFFDQYAVMLFVPFLLVCYLIGRKRRQLAREAACPQPIGSPAVASPTPQAATSKGDLLSHNLLNWAPRDPFPMRDLLRSVAIFGASGSGKTSGSGYQLAKALVAKTGKRRQLRGQSYGGTIGGLILASKPEDRQFWQKNFHEAGRDIDLIIFSPQTEWRFNFIDFIHKNGGDTRDITEAIMVMGETMEQGENPNRDPFWKEQNRRMIHNAVQILILAKGRVTAPDIQQFITTAALTPATLGTPEFLHTFHSQCMEQAFSNLHTAIEKHDYQLAADYWIKEYPVMADKTRSSVQMGALGILHVFNTGIVRELVSTTTNVSPIVMDSGMWILVDMPISSYGAAGAFILSGWKYLTQRHILHRYINDNTAATAIWSDEYQKVANSFDPQFLAECRSHRGCMVCLTQSIHSLYTRIQQAGEHGADALLTNFYHKIFHAVGDDKTAAYASSLIGKRLKMRVDASIGPQEGGAWEALYGEPKVSASTSQSIENILENREFMQGLRTGGPANGMVVDGIVVRSGEPFSNGEAWMRVAFSQK